MRLLANNDDGYNRSAKSKDGASAETLASTKNVLARDKSQKLCTCGVFYCLHRTLDANHINPVNKTAGSPFADRSVLRKKTASLLQSWTAM